MNSEQLNPEGEQHNESGLRLLVVEDDRSSAKAIRERMKSFGHETIDARPVNSKDFVRTFKDKYLHFDLAIVDVQLGENQTGGIEGAASLAELYPFKPILLISAGNQEICTQAVKDLDNVYGYIDKMAYPGTFYDNLNTQIIIVANLAKRLKKQYDKVEREYHCKEILARVVDQQLGKKPSSTQTKLMLQFLTTSAENKSKLQFIKEIIEHEKLTNDILQAYKAVTTVHK